MGLQEQLYKAAKDGDLEAVKALIARGVNINQGEYYGGRTPLWLAAEHGHLGVVRELLEHGATVNQANNSGDTPLFAAAQKGHLDVVRELLEHKAAVNQGDEGGRTPLFVAAMNGHLGVVQWLAEHGADVNQAIDTGFTPLWFAAQNGHVEVVRALLKAGAAVDQVDKDGHTPLWIADIRGHLKVVQLLVEHGAAVSMVTQNSNFILCAAAQNGHVEVARELLEAGVAVNKADKDGRIPLLVAAENGHVAVMLELLAHGAAVDCRKDQYGFTPLCIAAEKGHLENVKVLIAQGANVNFTSYNRSTPLFVAAKKGHLEVVQWLVEHGAAVDCRKDQYGVPPLFIAAVNGHLEVVQYLAEHGAAISAGIDEVINYAIADSGAAFNGHLDVVQWLAEHGATVDQVDKDGVTPLCIAAERGSLDLVKQLVSLGANIEKIGEKYSYSRHYNGYQHSNQSCKTDYYYTPLTIAAKNGHIDVVEFLLEKGVQSHEDVRSALGDHLNLASENGSLDLVKRLVFLGADLEKVGEKYSNSSHYGRYQYSNQSRKLDYSYTPILIAAKNGHLEIVAFLKAQGAQCHEDVRLALSTHLLESVTDGDVGKVKKLLALGADLEKTNADGVTSLWVAIQQGYLEIAEVLVENEAMVNVVGQREQTLLSLAVQKRNPAIATLLIKAGAKVTEQIERNLQQLLFPAVKNGDIESLSVLLNHKINIHVYDDSHFKNSTVAVAVSNNHLDVCKMLVAHGVDYVENNSRPAPILIAAGLGYTHFIEYFVKELKVDINSCDFTGANLLQIAIEAGHMELVKWLIDHEANIYQTRNDGTNSLYSALQHQNYEALEMLLAVGENLELGEIDKHKFSELVRILKQNIEPFREFITYSQQSKNLLSKLQILKVFAYFYTAEEKLEIEAAVQKFKDGCELYHIASKDGMSDFFDEALICFQSVNESFPRTGVIYNMLALTYMQLGDNERARELIEKAININSRNVIYLTNKVVLELGEGNFQEAAETLFKAAKLYFGGKALTIDLPNEATDHPEVMDASSSQFRTEIFTRVKNIVESEDKVSETLKIKLHETAIKLIAKALKYLSDTEQDLTDEQSVVGAMSDFDRVKNQLDGWFEEINFIIADVDAKMQEGFAETHKGISKVSVQLEGDGAYRPEFDPALTGEETAGASSSMDL